MNGRGRALYYLAPAFLIMIASLQIYRAQSLRQSPWAGGGFGMFAVIDGHPQRFVRVQLVTPRGDEPVDLPTGLEKEVLDVRVVPSKGNLAELGRRAFAILREEKPSSLGIRVEAVSRGFEPEPPRARVLRLGEVRITP